MRRINEFLKKCFLVFANYLPGFVGTVVVDEIQKTVGANGLGGDKAVDFFFEYFKSIWK